MEIKDVEKEKLISTELSQESKVIFDNYIKENPIIKDEENIEKKAEELISISNGPLLLIEKEENSSFAIQNKAQIWWKSNKKKLIKSALAIALSAIVMMSLKMNDDKKKELEKVELPSYSDSMEYEGPGEGQKTKGPFAHSSITDPEVIRTIKELEELQNELDGLFAEFGFEESGPTKGGK